MGIERYVGIESHIGYYSARLRSVRNSDGALTLCLLKNLHEWHLSAWAPPQYWKIKNQPVASSYQAPTETNLARRPVLFIDFKSFKHSIIFQEKQEEFVEPETTGQDSALSIALWAGQPTPLSRQLSQSLYRMSLKGAAQGVSRLMLGMGHT